VNSLPENPVRAQVSWIPLICAVGIMIALSIYPGFLVKPTGDVDRISAYLFFWSMTAGFIRGVGFIPKTLLLAIIFSGPACLITFTVSVVNLYAF
jgi:predicted membrane protein